MIYYSNCKINIGLDIIDRYDDGYHNINTVFYPVSGLCDAIEIIPNQSSEELEFYNTGIKVDCAPENNLCVKAYNILKSKYDIAGVKINLHKNIPVGTGLGAGSANATTVLKALNEIFELGLSQQELVKYASELGSDTAFFVDNVPALGTGRGTDLLPIEMSLKGLWLTIVMPSYSISTAKAYGLVTPKNPKFDLKNITSIAIEQWKESIYNDFEMPIFNLYPQLGEIKNRLYRCSALYVSMSGSGSAIFAFSNNQISLEAFNEYGICFQEKIK